MSAPLSLDAPWSLAGKTAIVTGASRGIGAATAIHLARKGVSKLAITYASDGEAAQATLNQCRALGVEQAIAIKADLLDPAFGPSLISQVLKGLDTAVIDIVVNNAVLSDQSKAQPIKDTTLSIFQETMQANVYAPITLTTSLLPHLPAQGGRVINISSTLAMQGNSDPTMTYGASKAALQSYTRSFADTFAKSTGATFNSIIVGLTATEAIKKVEQYMPPGFMAERIQETSAAERIGVPDDIAYIIGFLCSEEGRWVNGAAVSANGGNRFVMAALG